MKIAQAAVHTTLRIACMYCRRETGLRDGLGEAGTSHGICVDCWEERWPDWPYPGMLEALQFGVNLALEKREKLGREIRQAIVRAYALGNTDVIDSLASGPCADPRAARRLDG